MKICWSRLRRGNFRVAWLASALMVLICPGGILHAADSPPAVSPAPNAVAASLEYQETDDRVISWGVALTTQTLPFKKEPAAAGKMIRGILNFGGNAGNSIPFVWQRDAGKIYLDLNQNQDLTDDPAGVFSAREGQRINYQTFTNIHLSLNTAAGKCRVLADLHFYDYRPQPSCSLAVRSFWQGKVTLQGRDWQAGLVQGDLNPSGSFENSRLLLRPWEKRNQPPATVPFSRKVFIDGHAYQLDPAVRSSDGEARPALQFTEQSVALGELKITGKFIQRLILAGGPYLVVLDQPAASVKIPTGSYNPSDLRLEQNGAVALGDSSLPQSGRRFAVDDKTPAVLEVGGPLTNSVIVSRHGQDLRLVYRLVGAGGGTYLLANQDRSKPPQFAIYRGDKKIASGNFEFG